MIYNYLIISFRNLKKHWQYTLINVLGLSIGLTSFLLLFGYTSFEESFDMFHKNKDNIYAIVMERYHNNELKTKQSMVMPAMGYSIKNEITGIKHVTRYWKTGSQNTVKYNNTIFNENALFFGEPDFFKMFDIQFLKGNASQALSDRYSIVLTESTAKKYFKNENPICKILHIGNRVINRTFTVTGVVKNNPKNSSLNFDFLCSFSSIYDSKKYFKNNWVWWGFPTFVSFEDGYTSNNIIPQFPAYIKKYKIANNDANREWRFSFKPLKDIHLKSSFSNQAKNENKEAKKMTLLKFIALLIIIIAWVNYINLSTANATIRAKEVGIRKAIGASKKQLVIQFLIESILVNLIASILAIGLFFLIIEPFSSLLKINYINELISQNKLWLYFGFIITLGIIASGLYPAFVLSSFNSIDVLKTKSITTPANAKIRKILVGLQFIISLGLISATLIMIHQNHYMQSQNLGIDISQKLVIARPKFVKHYIFRQQYLNLFEKFKKIDGVSNVSAGNGYPSRAANTLGIWRLDKGIKTQKLYTVTAADENFIDIYNLKLIAGKNFKPINQNDHKKVIITEKMMKKLGFNSPENALGKKLGVELFNNWEFSICGILNDFHFKGLQSENSGIILMQNTHTYLTPQNFILKLDGTKSNNYVLKEAKKAFKLLYPNDIFQANVLEDLFDKQYELENRNQSIFTLFTSLAIFLACMGIIGLASFIAFLKVKELGLRKLFGAPIKSLAWILSKEFLSIFIGAIVIVVPIITYFMKQWLVEYPYRISISFWHFGIPILTICGITFLIICFNLFRILKKDPIKTLDG